MSRFLKFQVVLYNSNLTNLHNMTGDQIGAYFGYSVASGDLNGDGLDDVIIGAPMWTNYEVMGKFETGKVFVVYQNSLVNFFKKTKDRAPNRECRNVRNKSAKINNFYILNRSRTPSIIGHQTRSYEKSHFGTLILALGTSQIFSRPNSYSRL